MTKPFGSILLTLCVGFSLSCSRTTVPQSEIVRGPEEMITEFGEENLRSPSGSPIAGSLGTPDLLRPREQESLTFGDPLNSARPFEAVYFDFDQYTLDLEEREKVIEIAKFLMENRRARLLIEGYCDWKGTPAYNKALGSRRASTVRDFLLELGADPNQIDTLSIGDEDAIPNALEAQTRLDRRAEFVLSKVE
jgi:outer membrane protein OmpA-like peptidoglycan-associated protein